MLFRKILLAGISVGAIAFAGSASALTLTAIAGTGNGAGNALPTGTGFTAAAPLKLASQLNFTAGQTSTPGQFALVVSPNTAVPAGTYTVTVGINGATINAALPSTAVVEGANTPAVGMVATVPAGTTDGGALPTLSLATGGSVGASTFTFTLQISGNDTVSTLYFAPGLTVTGPVSFTVGINNQLTGQPVEPSAVGINLVTTGTSAFAVAVTPDTVPTNVATDGGAFALLANGAGVDNVIGSITTAVSPGVYKTLSGTPVAIGDVKSETVTVAGTFNPLKLFADANCALTPAGGPPPSPVAGTLATNCAAATTSGSITLSPTSASGTFNAVDSFSVATSNTNAVTIPPSTYTASTALTLDPTYYSATPLTATGAFQTVTTAGTEYIVPWVNSSNLAAQSGTTNIIRVSNIAPQYSVNTATANATNGVNGSTSAAGAPAEPVYIYGFLYNATGSGVTKTVATLGTIGTGGEVLITSATLQAAFGDFGRGDVRLVFATATGQATTGSIVVKRLIQSGGGGLTEVSVLPGGLLSSTAAVTTNNSDINLQNPQ